MLDNNAVSGVPAVPAIDAVLASHRSHTSLCIIAKAVSVRTAAMIDI